MRFSAPCRSSVWRHAATVYDDVAKRADNSAIAASARWSAIESSFARGDIASVLYDARSIAIRVAGSGTFRNTSRL